MKNPNFAEKLTLAGIVFVFALIVVTVTFGLKRENAEIYSASSLEYYTASEDAASAVEETAASEPTEDPVPSESDREASESPASTGVGTSSSIPSTVSSKIDEGLININEASADKLCELPGIGEKKAAAIIEYRTLNGKFKTVDDIKKVSGIGDATFEKIKALITVNLN